MPRFIVPYEGLNAPSHSFIISITMTFGLLYKIKMTIKIHPPYSWNYSNIISSKRTLRTRFMCKTEVLLSHKLTHHEYLNYLNNVD